MKNNNNQKSINNLFNEMDSNREKRRAAYFEALALSDTIEEKKEEIYEAIYNALPKSSEKAVPARQIANQLTDNLKIANRIVSIIANIGEVQDRNPDLYSYDLIHRKKKTFRSYSIECDENGTPIPGAFVITHKREKNVYWYQEFKK